jgi:excisionase family DNA binding protein
MFHDSNGTVWRVEITPVLFETLYTSRDAAAQLGVDHHTVSRWVQDGHMKPAQKVGTAWVFTAAEVDRVRKAHWKGKRGGYRTRRRSAAA